MRAALTGAAAEAVANDTEQEPQLSVVEAPPEQEQRTCAICGQASPGDYCSEEHQKRWQENQFVPPPHKLWWGAGAAARRQPFGGQGETWPPPGQEAS